MPIHINVYVNSKPIKAYHIGRLEGEAHDDSINTYVMFAGGVNENPRWDDGERFTHRYGDGIDVCIAKGIQALMSVECLEDHDFLRGKSHFIYCNNCGQRLQYDPDMP